MQRAALFALCLTIPALTIPALPLAALAETAPNLAVAEIAAPGPVRQMLLAQQLYDYALAQEDGFLILSAIRLAHRAELRPATGWSHAGEGLPVTSPPPSAPGLPQDPLSPEAIALAQMMAEGDSALIDLAADLAADIFAERGRPAPNRGQLSMARMALQPGEADSWTMAFYGQLTAEIALISDRDIDLSLRDESGQNLCDIAASTRAYCAFVPARNGFFTVTLTRPSGAAEQPAPAEAHYMLLTN